MRRLSAWRSTDASYGVRSCQHRERMRSPWHAKAGTAAWCAWPFSRCCGEETCAPKECRVDSAAHSPHVWRRHFGPWRHQWTQDCVPLRAVTGARPAYCWRASAEGTRAGCAPQATRRRGAHTAPAPGQASNTGKSGGSCACCAMVLSQSALAGMVPRRGATRACTRRTWGGDALAPLHVPLESEENSHLCALPAESRN